MDVLVLTEGSRSIGFGHLTRCLALAQGIEKYINKCEYKKHSQPENKVNIEFLINGDNLARKVLKNQKFRVKIKDWVKEYRDLEGKLKKIDLVIIDSYLATKIIYDFIYKKLHTQTIQQTTNRPIDSFVHKLICIDDYNRIKLPPSVIINGTIYGDKSNYPLYSSPDKHIYLLGEEYVILRKELWRVPRKYIKKKLKDVLITFGGGGYTNFTKKLLIFLAKNYPGLTYHVVTTYEKINFYKLLPNVHINQYRNLSPTEMFNLMAKCDIAISGGGQTLYELARVGVPAIGICFTEYQKKTLKGFHKEGFLENIEWYSGDKILNRINRAVRSLISQEVRRRKNIIGRNLVDGKGVERILINLAKIKYEKNKLDSISFRVVTKQDCRDLWLWRNNSDVRKWSFEGEEIEYESHKKWFEKKFKDKKMRIYIVQNSKGEKIGQIRFEEKTNMLTHVNINLNPKFIGKGFGSKIIKIATKSFMKERSNVKNIIAEIVAGNVISRKAFQKAGYVYSHNIQRKNKQITIYRSNL